MLHLCSFIQIYANSLYVYHTVSILLLFHPLFLTTATAPPSEVKIVPDNVTSSSFFLTWYPPPVETTNGPITAYILEYGESGSDTPPHIIPLSGVVEEYTVTGLKPHTKYHVKVAAENAAGRGPFCEPVLVQTAPDSEFCSHVSTAHYNPVAPQLYRTVIALLFEPMQVL